MVQVAEAISITAIALFSWHATNALVDEELKAIYSGSKSCATVDGVDVLFIVSWIWPKILTPWASNAACWELKEAKPISVTTGFVKLLETSINETDPTGSFIYQSSGSPSLAHITLLPSGDQATISGW